MILLDQRRKERHFRHPMLSECMAMVLLELGLGYQYALRYALAMLYPDAAVNHPTIFAEVHFAVAFQ